MANPVPAGSDVSRARTGARNCGNKSTSRPADARRGHARLSSAPPSAAIATRARPPTTPGSRTARTLAFGSASKSAKRSSSRRRRLGPRHAPEQLDEFGRCLAEPTSRGRSSSGRASRDLQRAIPAFSHATLRTGHLSFVEALTPSVPVGMNAATRRNPDPLGRIKGSACIEGIEPPGAAQFGRFRLWTAPLIGQSSRRM
jgi:hypothetical protein